MSTMRARRLVCAAVATLGVLLAASASAAGGTLFVGIRGIGAVPGVDYNSVVTDEPIDLDGFALVISPEFSPSCGEPDMLPTGQTYTLLSTTGGLTGRLARMSRRLEEGDLTGPWSSFARGCGFGEGPTFRINYHESGPAQSVTATVVDGSPTPVTAVDLRSSEYERQTNQPVRFTATVTVSSGIASGRVSFRDDYPDNDEVACPDQHVVSTPEHPGVATCTTSFSASDLSIWSARLRATFEPDDPAVMRGSHGGGGVYMTPGTTTTSVETPAGTTAGVPFIATATVTPSFLGPVVPGGSVTFSVEGRPRPRCTAYLVGGPAPYATCELSFDKVGSHELTAAYRGDDNFGASSSPVQLVAVEPPRVAPVEPPAAAPRLAPAPGPGAAARVRTHAPRRRRAAARVGCRPRHHAKRTHGRRARTPRCRAIHRRGRAR